MVIGLLCLFPIAIILYFCRAIGNTINRRRHTSQQIAHMEAELGIMPPTEGECRKCGKVLHIGAEYCAFCGEAVIERPQICPNCAASALPGARYCPKCRTPLEQTMLSAS